MTAKQETEHSAEELADGVIAHAEVGIQGAVAGLGSDAVIGLGRLLCAAGDADAILVVAGDVCGNNCTAVSADNVVSAVAVVHIGPVVAHVVAGVLSTAGAGALAVLTVNTLSSFRHNCTALSADDLVSAVAVVLVLEGAVGAGVAADTGAGLKNAGHISVIDGAVLVDSVNMMMRSIDHGVGSANFLRLGSAAGDADAVLIGAGHVFRNDGLAVSADDVVGAVAVVHIGPVVARVVALGLLLCTAGDADAVLIGAGHVFRNDGLAVSADDVVGAVVVVLKGPVVARVVAVAGVSGRLLCVAANTSTVLIPDVSRGIDDSCTSSADVRAGTITVINTYLLDVLALCSSESSRSHGQNHCACQHGGQKAAELFQFHKTDLLYTTKFLILPRAASQFIHAWTAGTSHFRNILRVVQWFTLGLPLL